MRRGLNCFAVVDFVLHEDRLEDLALLSELLLLAEVLAHDETAVFFLGFLGDFVHSRERSFLQHGSFTGKSHHEGGLLFFALDQANQVALNLTASLTDLFAFLFFLLLLFGAFFQFRDGLLAQDAAAAPRDVELGQA